MKFRYLILLIIAFLVFSSMLLYQNKSATAPMQKTFALEVKNKKLVGGQQKLQVRQADTVTFLITSDQAEEFHLHGYDKSVDLQKGKQVKLSVKADISGKFSFELEHAKVDLGDLEVQPK